MFDMNAEVRRWREQQERESSLSPRELDELEDHLRARVDLEMELDATLAAERAFAVARHELGGAAVLSEEFAKAGKPRWRRWIITGWAMFAASAFLPVADTGSPILGQELLVYVLLDMPDGVPFLLMNLAMIMSVPALWGSRVSCNRWLRRFLGAVGMCGLGMAVGNLGYGSSQTGGIGWLTDPTLLVGFWAWSASFVCVAAALRSRAKEWAPARQRPHA